MTEGLEKAYADTSEQADSKGVKYDGTSSDHQLFVEKYRLNPFDLPLVPEGSRVALHLETKDITKGGIHLTDKAKKEIAEAESKNNSKLYFVTAVSESVYQTSKYRPGMWVLLSPEAMGHSCKINGKEILLVEAYAIAGIVASHQDEETTSQYTSFAV